MSSRDGSSSSSSSSGGNFTTEEGRRRFTMPTSAALAPRGASLGQSVETGGSIASLGGGQSIDLATGARQGTFTGTRINPPRTGPTIAPTNMGGGDGSPIPTQVTQRPSAGGPAPGNDNELRALASEITRGPERDPATSNNFLSIVGGAGGLGRRTSAAKRTLIGGA